MIMLRQLFILLLSVFVIMGCQSEPEVIYPSLQERVDTGPVIQASIPTEARPEKVNFVQDVPPEDPVVVTYNPEIEEKLDKIDGRLQRVEGQQKEIIKMQKQEREKAKIIPVAAPIEKEPEVQKPVKSIAKKQLYYLRIISLDDHDYFKEMADQIVNFLSKNGIPNATSRKSGNYRVVDIGGFESMKSLEATSLQEKVVDMIYQGRNQFKDSYFINY